MAVFLPRQAVHDFIHRAVASASDYELAAFVVGTLRHFGGVAGLGGFLELRLNAACRENTSSFIEHGATALAAVSGVGVVNQECVLDFRGHPSFTSGSESFIAVFILYNVGEIELAHL